MTGSVSIAVADASEFYLSVGVLIDLIGSPRTHAPVRQLVHTLLSIHQCVLTVGYYLLLLLIVYLRGYRLELWQKH